MSLTAETPSKTNRKSANRQGNWVTNTACVTAIFAAVGYGWMASFWEQSDYSLLVIVFGVLLGSAWSGSFYRSAWGVAASFAGAAGVPLARTFC